MIPAGQPINEDLEARKFADLQARREPDMNTTVARAGWDGDMSSGWVDPIATTTKFAHSHDIRIDESQRVFVLPNSDGLGARAGLIAGALITVSGLTWLVISALPLPFASASVDRSSGGPNSSTQIPASNKGDRLPIPNAFIREAVSASSREAVAVAPLEPKPSSDAQRQARLDSQIFEERGAAPNVDKSQSQCAGPSGSGKISSGAGDETDYH